MKKSGKLNLSGGSKRKVLFFVEAFGGGVFTYIVDLANSLSENYEVWIAHGMRAQTPKNYMAYFNCDIKLIQVKNYAREISVRNDIKAFREMKQLVSQINPDIIHLHSTKAGVLGRVAFSGKKYALFYTPHGYSFLMDNCSQVKKLVYKSIEKICGQARCMTISCSAGEHLESLKLARKSAYINNGINIEYLQRLLDQTEVKGKKELLVFTLGRICYQKNPELFNEIAKQLPNVKFLWIGDGELRKVLTSNNIQIMGWVSREDALKYSKNADVFLLTSLWEGLPISLLEAMFMKKLCIVTNVIGNKDVITSGENGFVCEKVEDFVDVIKKVQANQSEFDYVTKEAYREILEEYNTKVMAKKYSDRYQEVLKS